MLAILDVHHRLQFRGTGLSSVLGRHAFLTAMLRWNPDYFFGFMSKGLVFKGYSARFGYMHTEPDAIRYVMKGTGHGIAPDGLSVALAFMRDKLSL